MVWNVSGMAGYTVEAHDGTVGPFDSFLFEDSNWTIRWAVIDAGSWLFGRRVLVAPSALGVPDASRRVFPVDLTRQQIEESPELDEDAPVSRQHESDIYAHYGWQPYWGGAAPLPMPGAPGMPAAPAPAAPDAVAEAEAPAGDPHLRSTNEVSGYYVHAMDDEVGHIEDFLIEAGSWTIRYVVVDTKNWWPGRKVLISPLRFKEVSWGERKVRVDLTREQIVNAPEYDSARTEDPPYDDSGQDYFWYGYV